MRCGILHAAEPGPYRTPACVTAPALQRTATQELRAALRPGHGTDLLPRSRLDRFHVGVRQAEVVADLVDEDMADDMAERLVVLGPVIEDWPPVQPDHVGQPRDVVIALLRQAGALEQAEQIEF